MHSESDMRGMGGDLRTEAGQDAVEYVLLALLIALAIMVGLVMLSTVQDRSFSNAAACVRLAGTTAAAGGGGGAPGAPGGGSGVASTPCP